MDPSICVKVIIAHIRDKFNYTISYRKAWMAKQKAIESIYGNGEQSYAELPQWLMVMERDIPGTVIEFEPEANGNDLIFHRLFWAFRTCIEGFKHCKPIIQVDGTWLKGKYRGTLLLAVAQDGNNKIFPIAFALVEGETKEAWSFFPINLRKHVTPEDNMCVISDRHKAIKGAYDDPQNGWKDAPITHVYCILHIEANFMKAIKDGELRKYVKNAGYAMNVPSFDYYRNEIRIASPQALAWIDKIPKEKWTQSHDGGRRWGHMTTNLVESMNNMFKGTRSLPITALVKASYYRLGALFARRGYEASARLSIAESFSSKCMDYLKNEVLKASTHQVIQFDRSRHNFSVRETIDHKEGLSKGEYKVDLQNSWCDCGKLQALHLPCSHVIATCSSFAHDYKTFVVPKFSNLSVYGVYNVNFDVVHGQQYWPIYQGPKLYHNPTMRRSKKGCPASTRIRNEMDIPHKNARKCGACGTTGHLRKNCPNVTHR